MSYNSSGVGNICCNVLFKFLMQFAFYLFVGQLSVLLSFQRTNYWVCSFSPLFVHLYLADYQSFYSPFIYFMFSCTIFLPHHQSSSSENHSFTLVPGCYLMVQPFGYSSPLVFSASVPSFIRDFNYQKRTGFGVDTGTAEFMQLLWWAGERGGKDKHWWVK